MLTLKAHTLQNIIDARIVTKSNTYDNEFFGQYVGDTLSNVLNHINENNLFITTTYTINTLAVAYKRGVKVIVLCEDKKFSEDVIDKANELGIAILLTPLSAVEVLRRLFQIEGAD